MGGRSHGAVLEANLSLDANEIVPARCAPKPSQSTKRISQLIARLGRFGAALLAQSSTILTHCNAGALATAGYGTALGVVRAAKEAGKKIAVFADETRPFLQGSRLTAWELHKDKIPVTVIADNMAATVLRRGSIDCVIVGTDRTAANGDVANKIGTYPLAVMARRHNVPFYVAAPLSSIDLNARTGDRYPDRGALQPRTNRIQGQADHAQRCRAFNPAFDVTPHESGNRDHHRARRRVSALYSKAWKS